MHRDIHARLFHEAEEFDNIQIIDLAPYFAKFENDGTRFSYDGLHMNEKGHQTIAEIIYPIVDRLSDSILRRGSKGN